MAYVVMVHDRMKLTLKQLKWLLHERVVSSEKQSIHNSQTPKHLTLYIHGFSRYGVRSSDNTYCIAQLLRCCLARFLIFSISVVQLLGTILL